MELRVNGEAYFTERETIRELLGEMDIVPDRVAVEVNLKVIKRAEYEGYKLQEGDSIEVVYFVGGGEQGEPIGNGGGRRIDGR
jgi:thiamine biosynthesis protein ThiS